MRLSISFVGVIEVFRGDFNILCEDCDSSLEVLERLCSDAQRFRGESERSLSNEDGLLGEDLGRPRAGTLNVLEEVSLVVEEEMLSVLEENDVSFGGEDGGDVGYRSKN